MKLSGGVESALHCCVVLTAADAPVPAVRLAEFHEVSPTYLAKQLQALSRAGLIRSVQGHDGGYVLARAATDISLLDVVQAVDGATPAFVCTEIRQRGPLGVPAELCTAPCPIAKAMAAADEAWQASLASMSIADLAAGVSATARPDPLVRVRGWLSPG